MRGQRLKQGEAVRVDWQDSAETPGWRYGTAAQGGITHIRSIGWVVCNKPQSLTISTSQDEEGGNLAPLSIPWCAITAVKRVETDDE